MLKVYTGVWFTHCSTVHVKVVLCIIVASLL